MSEKPVARRCTMCALSLPDDPKWGTCPQCGQPTDFIRGGGPNVTDEEATKLLRARQFGEYLEKEGIT